MAAGGAALPYHVPVMLDEVVGILDPKPGERFLDCTVGGGGHAAAVAARVCPGGRLIGLDRDAEAIAEAGRRLAPFGECVTLIRERFDNLTGAAARAGVDVLDGCLFDLGVSSHQLDTPERGFSFKDPSAPLDMRMDPSREGDTAASLLNRLAERDLATLIRDYSDERWAPRIARFAAERRRAEPYATVGQLVDTVHAAIPAGARPPDTHAATRTFQALRIAVNGELAILEPALESAIGLLSPNGRLAVLTYHSLEDRIVKQLFARLSGRGESVGPYGDRPVATVALLTKKPIDPGDVEVAANPRSRSAKLRAVRRL
jgi:16S rRNA (cytosine1402-N4)-methyltransferase